MICSGARTSSFELGIFERIHISYNIRHNDTKALKPIHYDKFSKNWFFLRLVLYCILKTPILIKGFSQRIWFDCGWIIVTDALRHT